MAGEAQSQSQPCLPLPVCSAQSLSGSGEAHPCWYCRHWTTKRHTPPQPRLLLAWALAYSWRFINVCQERIREKPADRWRRESNRQNCPRPSSSAVFSGGAVRAEGKGGPHSPGRLLDTRCTKGKAGVHGVVPAWQPAAGRWPGGQRGLHRGEGARTEGSTAVIRGCCPL